MKANNYAVLTMAIEDGVAYGLDKALDPVEELTIEEQRDVLVASIMAEINDWFTFGETE
jgi:hypothetical protein